MSSPIAVIDLGTNTFHLLIAQPQDSRFKELFRERRFVRLAENGIERIHEASFARGMEALAYFRKRLDEYHVEQFKAFGTAALRTASNGDEFRQKALEDYQIQIETISGEEEARLIQLGVAQAVPFNDQKDLIMDIGGGSVEFLVADRDQVYWSSSFPVGVAVLFGKFHHHDPILEAELKNLNAFLEEALQPLFEVLQKYSLHRLIGASGTFDVLENLAVKEKQHPLRAELPIEEFPKIYSELIFSTLAFRKNREGIPPERAEMIVVAMELLNTIIRQSGVQKIVVSAYAMKEGIMYEMIHHNGTR